MNSAANIRGGGGGGDSKKKTTDTTTTNFVHRWASNSSQAEAVCAFKRLPEPFFAQPERNLAIMVRPKEPADLSELINYAEECEKGTPVSLFKFIERVFSWSYESAILTTPEKKIYHSDAEKILHGTLYDSPKNVLLGSSVSWRLKQMADVTDPVWLRLFVFGQNESCLHFKNFSLRSDTDTMALDSLECVFAAFLFSWMDFHREVAAAAALGGGSNSTTALSKDVKRILSIYQPAHLVLAYQTQTDMNLLNNIFWASLFGFRFLSKLPALPKNNSARQPSVVVAKHERAAYYSVQLRTRLSQLLFARHYIFATLSIAIQQARTLDMFCFSNFELAEIAHQLSHVNGGEVVKAIQSTLEQNHQSQHKQHLPRQHILNLACVEESGVVDVRKSLVTVSRPDMTSDPLATNHYVPAHQFSDWIELATKFGLYAQGIVEVASNSQLRLTVHASASFFAQPTSISMRRASTIVKEFGHAASIGLSPGANTILVDFSQQGGVGAGVVASGQPFLADFGFVDSRGVRFTLTTFHEAAVLTTPTTAAANTSSTIGPQHQSQLNQEVFRKAVGYLPGADVVSLSFARNAAKIVGIRAIENNVSSAKKPEETNFPSSIWEIFVNGQPLAKDFETFKDETLLFFKIIPPPIQFGLQKSSHTLFTFLFPVNEKHNALHPELVPTRNFMPQQRVFFPADCAYNVQCVSGPSAVVVLVFTKLDKTTLPSTGNNATSLAFSVVLARRLPNLIRISLQDTGSVDTADINVSVNNNHSGAPKSFSHPLVPMMNFLLLLTFDEGEPCRVHISEKK